MFQVPPFFQLPATFPEAPEERPPEVINLEALFDGAPIGGLVRPPLLHRQRVRFFPTKKAGRLTACRNQGVPAKTSA